MATGGRVDSFRTYFETLDRLEHRGAVALEAMAPSAAWAPPAGGAAWGGGSPDAVVLRLLAALDGGEGLGLGALAEAVGAGPAGLLAGLGLLEGSGLVERRAGAEGRARFALPLDGADYARAAARGRVQP